MASKFFYLYLVAGTMSLLLAGYHNFGPQQPEQVHNTSYFYFIPAVLFYYLAYKAYHEKKDRELM
jgi:amino acid permease